MQAIPLGPKLCPLRRSGWDPIIDLCGGVVDDLPGVLLGYLHELWVGCDCGFIAENGSKMAYKSVPYCPLLAFMGQKVAVFSLFWYQFSHFSVIKVVIYGVKVV